MNYSVGENLAECGFRVLEKIHEPILLVNKLGCVVKINEAGRKADLQVVTTFYKGSDYFLIEIKR